MWWLGIVGLLLTGRLVSCQHPISYKYLLADGDRCKSASPDVIIWVQGRATSVHLRAMLRETMGNSKMWPDNIRVTMLFFMGRLPEKDESYQPIIDYEFEMYRDIIQNDYIEGYKNQTFKMMSAINYIADHCSNSKLILRIDDDVIFHPALILNKLLKIFARQQTIEQSSIHFLRSRLSYIPTATIACKLISDFSIWRKKDHPKHFNAVDESVLPGVKLYPPFCAGFFIAMSGNVPALLKPHIARNKPFWMDDRYMGVLQEQAVTRNIDISSLLDFGYGPITFKNIDAIATKDIIARHLPNNLELHITQLFEYLRLVHLGLQGTFRPIRYMKRYKR